MNQSVTIRTPLAPVGGEGPGVRGMSEVRKQKSEIRTDASTEPLLTSDFCVPISEDPLTLYPSPPEGEREGTG